MLFASCGMERVFMFIGWIGLARPCSAWAVFVVAGPSISHLLRVRICEIAFTRYRRSDVTGGVNREGFLSGGSHALLVVAGASVAANSLKLVSFAFAVRWRIYRITGFAASPIFRFSLPGLISAFLGFNPPSRFIGKIASGVSSFVFGGFVLSRRPSIVQPDGTFTESFSGLQQEFSRTGRARHADIVA